jgi:MFS family permease
VNIGQRWQFGLGRENGLLFWTMMAIEGSFGAYMPIWPLYIEELGAPIALVGLLLGVSGIIRLFVLLPTATLARKLGSKRLMLLARLTTALTVLAVAAAPSWEWLLPLMLGIAAGSMAFPLVLAAVAANAGEANRVRSFSYIITIGPSIAMIIAPLVSSLLISQFGLRAPFVFSALLTLVSVAIISRLSEEAAPAPESEEAAERPGSYRSALSHPPLRRTLLLILMTVFATGLGASLLPNYLKDSAGYSDDLIALLFSIQAVGSIIFGALVIRNPRFSAAPLRGAAVAIAAVGLAYVLFLVPTAAPIVVLAFLLRGGMFGSFSLFSSQLGAVTRPQDRHYAFTLSEIFIVTGFSTAPIIAGVLFNVWPPLPLIVAAGLIVPVILILLRADYQRSPEIESAVTA